MVVASQQTTEPPTTSATLGELIRRKRRELKLNQHQAGLVFGVDQSTVAKWERGDNIRIERIEEVADWVGVSLEDAFRRSRLRPLPSTPVGGDVDAQIAALTRRVEDYEAFITETLGALRVEFAALAAEVRGERAAKPAAAAPPRKAPAPKAVAAKKAPAKKAPAKKAAARR